VPQDLLVVDDVEAVRALFGPISSVEAADYGATDGDAASPHSRSRTTIRCLDYRFERV